MLQLLPCGIPTLQSTSTGNWTRPDNVFGTERLAEVVISCNTDPGQRGPRTDHVPIQLVLDLRAAKTNDTPSKNWKDTEWDDFNKHLAGILEASPPRPLASAEEFQQAAKTLTDAITRTIEECVPQSKPSPHSKRWWSRELTNMRQQVNDLSRQAYQLRGLPNHPCHEDLKTLKKRY
ncbi:hypothetical protein BDR06DRAFT_889056, partial [Suillus hirtellus]